MMEVKKVRKITKTTKLEKEKMVFIDSHPSLKVVGVFDIFAAIFTMLSLIPFFIFMDEINGLERSYQIIIHLFLAYSIIAIIYALAIRLMLLERGYKTLAVTLNVLFSFGIPLEFVASIIIGCSILYKEDKDFSFIKEKRVLYKDDYEEVFAIYDYYLKNEKDGFIYDPRIIELKNKIRQKKLELERNIKSIETVEKKVGVSYLHVMRQKKLKEELIKCEETLKICGPEIIESHNDLKTEPINYDIKKEKDIILDEKALYEAYQKLPLDKQELYNKHRHYLDAGIYTNAEFLKKVSYLFEEF